MPMQRERYPPDWKQIAAQVKARAGWRCEGCGIAHGTERPNAKGRPFKERIAAAHLGVPYEDGRPGDPRDKMDCRDENLAALCTVCHLRTDVRERLISLRLNTIQRQIDAGQLVLIDE